MHQNCCFQTRVAFLCCACTFYLHKKGIELVHQHFLWKHWTSAKEFLPLQSFYKKTVNQFTLYVCVAEEHPDLRRLAISDAGSDWSSGLREERADPPTVSGSGRILRLWVSVQYLNYRIDMASAGGCNQIPVCVCIHRICHTTRGPYYGEENGVDYHFVNEEEFQHMIHMVHLFSIKAFWALE